MKKGWRRPLELLIKIVEIMLEIQHVELEINGVNAARPRCVKAHALRATRTLAPQPRAGIMCRQWRLRRRVCGLSCGGSGCSGSSGSSGGGSGGVSDGGISRGSSGDSSGCSGISCGSIQRRRLKRLDPCVLESGCCCYALLVIDGEDLLHEVEKAWVGAAQPFTEAAAFGVQEDIATPSGQKELLGVKVPP